MNIIGSSVTSLISLWNSCTVSSHYLSPSCKY